MYNTILITCQPDDQYFIWQNHLYIESCLQQGFKEDQIHILLYKPSYRTYNSNWEKLKTIYPNLNIYLYEDKGVQQYLGIYIPILRPHILTQHFEKFPELSQKTIIYTDCDILWVGKLDIFKYLEDDINYISDANSYLNYDYLKKKESQVLPEKKEEFDKIDVIQDLCDIVGISKEKLIENNNNSGGVQYILKNMNSDFWKKVEKDVLEIRLYLLGINKKYFKNENEGYQSWCADLWAMMWNFYFYNKEVKVISELNFAWSPDPIEKLNTHTILHNAGITGNVMNGIPMFYKGKYHQGLDPTTDEHLQIVLENKDSQKKCNWYYANELNKLKSTYKLKY